MVVGVFDIVVLVVVMSWRWAYFARDQEPHTCFTLRWVLDQNYIESALDHPLTPLRALPYVTYPLEVSCLRGMAKLKGHSVFAHCFLEAQLVVVGLLAYLR